MLRILIFFVLFCGWISIKAQNSLYQNQENRNYRTAVELMQKQKFSAARQAFDQYISDYPEGANGDEARYYRALCALNLYNPDAESLYQDFVENYNYHPKAAIAYYELGSFYFRKEDYKKAIDYFEQVPLARLDPAQQLEARFKLAYGYFSQKQFEQALEKFSQIKTSSSKYSAAASYYAGYIEYRNGDYDQALVDLERARQQESYARLVPDLVANIYYKQGKYDELLAYIEKTLEDQPRDHHQELYLLAGEAYYFKQEYSRAAEYYQLYAQSTKRNLTPDAQYKLAYALYATEEYDPASEKFKALASREEEVGQFASYYLGEVYVRYQNLNYAAPAYLKASRDTYNEGISEAAAFKYNKVQYDLGNYSQTVSGLEQFLEDHPQSSFKEEASDLLSEAYLNTNDYDQAIQHLEQLENKSPRARRTYQKVTYYRGTEYFNNSQYYKAVQMFEKSLENPMDAEIALLANYWSGEAYSIGKKFDEAITSYRAVIKDQSHHDHPQYIRSRYGLGYAYYNTGQYPQALQQFNTFLNEYKSDNRFYNDALIRAADCHYVLKEYQEAIKQYDQAITRKSHDQDYAMLQKGTILSILGNRNEARRNFSSLITEFPKSRFADNAVYQRAQLDLESGQYQQAVDGFTSLTSDFPNSDLIPFAYTKRALAYYNLKQYEKTLADYRTVLEQHINHESAHDALIGMQETLNMLGRSGEFERYFASYKAANPEDGSLANIEYETAVNLYLNQDYEDAVDQFNEFIQAYPQHHLVYEARFYIAESYFRLNNLQQAIDYYQTVVDENRITQVNRARRRLADLWFEQGDYRKAINAYQELEASASTKKESYYAWSGLMESHLILKEYTEADRYANLILEQGAVDTNASNRSLLVRGKAAYSNGDIQTATDHFLSTLNTAQDENGAEAQYMLAKIQHEQGQYKQSNETLYDLNNRFANYGYWLGRSFLLISDNYIGLDEQFQARATLESIIENAPETEIVEEAKEKLANLDEERPQEYVEEDSVQFEIIGE